MQTRITILGCSLLIICLIATTVGPLAASPYEVGYYEDFEDDVFAPPLLGHSPIFPSPPTDPLLSVCIYLPPPITPSRSFGFHQGAAAEFPPHCIFSYPFLMGGEPFGDGEVMFEALPFPEFEFGWLEVAYAPGLTMDFTTQLRVTEAGSFSIPLEDDSGFIHIRFQGHGVAIDDLVITAYCGVIPVGDSSWGRIKALYR